MLAMVRALLLFMLILMGMGRVYASETPVTMAENLQVDGKLAEQNGMVILVFVTLPTCSICEYVKENHIEPMIKAGEYADTVIIRELSLEEYNFTDFDGKSIDSTRFVRRYKANFSPAILFLSSSGEQLHKPIIGMSSRDYYGFYLNKAIKKSLSQIDKEDS